MIRRHVTGVFALAALVAPNFALQAQQVVRLTPSNGRVAIWNLLGTAHIEQGTSSEVEVQITPRGADVARMITRTGLIDGQQTLRIFYPVDEIRPPSQLRSRRGGSYTALRLRDDGRFDGNNNDGRRIRISSNADFEASADLVIRVPANVSLDLHVALGDVYASGATRHLSIDTYSGNVRSNATRGPLNIDTGSGQVEVKSHTGELSVDTGSGAVTLIAPSDFGAELEISAGSGSTRSDLPLQTLRRSEGELSARIGDGRSRISIETGSGGVSIRGRL